MLRSSLLLFALLAVLMLHEVSTDRAHGQAKAQPNRDKKGRLPIDSDKLKEEWNKREPTFRVFYKGDMAADEKNQDHKETIDTAAKWHAYRLTWIELHPSMAKLVKDVEQTFDTATGVARKEQKPTQAFIQMFGKQLAIYLKDVLDNDYPIARVNAALLLARVAMETGQEELADTFVAILKDDQQNDAVKYYALKGLKGLFDKLPEAKMKDPERLARTVLALLDVLGRKLQINPDVPEEVEGARTLRRTAVSALAATHIPVLLDKEKVKGKDGKPQGAVALALARVLRNDGLELPPRVDEQVEAAIGLARIHPKLCPDGMYQPDYAAYQLGQFVTDFAVLYQNRGTGREKDRPWKVYAAKLADALDAMKQDTPARTPGGKYVAEVVDRSKPILDTIERGGNANAAALGNWLKENEPPNKMLYKGIEASTVKPPAEPPEK